MLLKRPIRSFVKREGRLTPSQLSALEMFGRSYAIEFEPDKTIHPALYFANPHAPLIVDIGFGNGISLLEMAKAHPEQNFIGIEVYRAGAGQVMRQAHELGLSNVKIIIHDAVEVLAQFLEESVDRFQVYFPDPWPKKRHHKRRLIQPDFIASLVRLLKPEGHIHCATDWVPYAEHMLAVMTEEQALKNVALTGGYVPKPDFRPQTKFESRGERLGHEIRDLLFKKNAV